MWRVVSAVLALLTAGVIYFVLLVYKKRAELDGLPQPPMEGGRFWGHLKIAGDCKRLFPPNCHMQNWTNYIRKKYNLGDVFYVDWWPLGPRWVFIADPVLASKFLTTGQSLPKSRLVGKYLAKLLGPSNMVSLEGQAWKSLRSIFNPGFSASHLITLVPYVVDSSLVLLDLLREKAETNEVVELDPLTIGFAIDIIGKVVMDSDFDSQKRPHPIVTTFRKQVHLMPTASSIGPLDDINLLRPLRLWWNRRKLDRLLGAEIDKKVAARKTLQKQPLQPANGNGNGKGNGHVSDKKPAKERKRSVVDLALDAYEKEVASGAAGVVTSSFRSMAIDSIKTFIFAGHDTTSATISYTMYLLHLHPKVYKRLVAELDDVYGSDTSAEAKAALIKDDPHSINKLEYLTAVIKEVLRLFPAASTIRELKAPSDVSAVKATSIIDPSTGKECPLVGFDIWPVAHMIHRNEAYFPQPLAFIPERFIPSETPFPDAKLHTPDGKDAWRPFEKGPRNCIGQELAMMEAKVVIALTVKDVDFTAEFDGQKIEPGDWIPTETKDEFKDGVSGEVRHTVEGHRPYQVLCGAARPRGGMSGRLKLRERAR
ncbi:aflN/ verA/ monooxygenase [Cladophialophora carrionii]|uniref:AflN/ verA/ monooxygenase n=1 Tax=Cladophialophora carrionii TaxID=86049 RepID=A0A1C1CQ07_9EURO|nr:aflN/ verA/ monooxygenase [Cladophialophora carrionii]